MADDPQNGRIARQIYSHAYVPTCPVHRTPMGRSRTGSVVVYFACTAPGCPHKGKAPRVTFLPKSR